MSIRFWNSFKMVMILILITCFISLFILLLTIKCKAKFIGMTLNVKEYKILRNNELIGYLGSYLLPVVSVSMGESQIKNLFVWIILISLGGIVYIFNNLFYLNPLLNIFGYKIYNFESNEEEFIFITKKSFSHLKSGEKLGRIRLHDNIFFEGEL
ncbi:hypothetical protein [Candidatus Cetobacterium colombiensis]|uniref:DUF304 domain-containing protein n=1 Tax=Candidatus Cetobacterium colombiensis TaxID=3073100 RepID=A0ABU4WFM4_9FUSO|nr:hypothetical protein [Candidatus Cetobacterium colombiensis]MDX8337356.1 hypothetical protein [Candidatus Cetobacterium colombiensis]